MPPICTCTPTHRDLGQHATDCLVHAHYRCTVRGCEDVAVQGHECVLHGRRRSA